jgi:hypothetical protein
MSRIKRSGSEPVQARLRVADGIQAMESWIDGHPGHLLAGSQLLKERPSVLMGPPPGSQHATSRSARVIVSQGRSARCEGS